jgi:glycosyltransferase involved in cell wall biosynthesis
MKGPSDVSNLKANCGVVAVGQIPPPYGGQAIMIEKMLIGSYERLTFHPVPMSFSREMAEVGRFQLRKLLLLPWIIVQIIFKRLRFRAQILYYPPAGPDRIPFYRDVVILVATRWCFSRTVFHFHAGGLGELYPRLNRVERLLFRMAYSRPDVAIRLSNLSPPDHDVIKAKTSPVVPYGIDDFASRAPGDTSAGISAGAAETDSPLRILFVGVLRESKGVRVLLEACDELSRERLDFRLDLMGRFQSQAFEKTIRAFARDRLGGRVSFLGVCTGEEKWRAFERASIFGFPTFFESEALPIVLIEAMNFGLPIVAAAWRGVPYLVEDGRTGLLVPPRDPEALADALRVVLTDSETREAMGRAGRERYLRLFTIQRWRRDLESAILHGIRFEQNDI